MKATLLLADHADVVNGKLYINGGGWDWIRPGVPFAIALIVHVTWDQTNMKHSVVLELLDTDGDPVVAPDGNPVRIPFDPLELGRPAGVKPGTTLNQPYAVFFPNLPLQGGTQYVWQLSLDGHADEEWRLTFSTTPAPPEALAA